LLRERRELETIIARYEAAPVASLLRQAEEADAQYRLEGGGSHMMPSPPGKPSSSATPLNSSTPSDASLSGAATTHTAHAAADSLSGKKNYRKQESDAIFGLEQELLVTVKALANEKNDRMSQQRMYVHVCV
jgi:hypothetical protein